LDSGITTFAQPKFQRQKQIQIKIIPGGIRFLQEFPGPATIDLFDITGSLVKTVRVSQTANQIATESLKGMFLMRIKTGRNMFLRGAIAIP